MLSFEILMKFLSNYLPLGVWLGGEDMNTDGVWVWSSTNNPISTTESDWDTPNGNPGSEQCMLLYLAFGNRWRDTACDEEHAFICERGERLHFILFVLVKQHRN